ncbi:hypothetical protein AB395_00003122 [Sinorhizobium fredii CCBAU 45436]|nr:hypothetical protein SF83666_c29850 [Sinorhizobium fredii CCBAU 83666]AWI58765.1 hypothetical protein AB395_00003122 [Sinorhizobium fredii CCBAU 45436]
MDAGRARRKRPDGLTGDRCLPLIRPAGHLLPASGAKGTCGAALPHP